MNDRQTAKVHGFKFHWINRSGPGRIYRVARIVWQRGRVGDGTGYSSKLTFALNPRLFLLIRGRDDTTLVIAGMRWHLQRSYGGTHV